MQMCVTCESKLQPAGSSFAWCWMLGRSDNLHLERWSVECAAELAAARMRDQYGAQRSGSATAKIKPWEGERAYCPGDALFLLARWPWRLAEPWRVWRRRQSRKNISRAIRNSSSVTRFLSSCQLGRRFECRLIDCFVGGRATLAQISRPPRSRIFISILPPRGLIAPLRHILGSLQPRLLCARRMLLPSKWVW